MRTTVYLYSTLLFFCLLWYYNSFGNKTPFFIRALKMTSPWKMFIELQPPPPSGSFFCLCGLQSRSCSVTSYLQDTLSTSSTSQVTCHINAKELCLKYASHWRSQGMAKNVSFSYLLVAIHELCVEKTHIYGFNLFISWNGRKVQVFTSALQKQNMLLHALYLSQKKIGSKRPHCCETFTHLYWAALIVSLFCVLHVPKIQERCESNCVQ